MQKSHTLGTRPKILYALVGLFLVACSMPTSGQLGNVPRVVERISPPAIPTQAIPTPASFIGQFKTCTFDTSSDFGYNQKWFFQTKSAGASANPTDFQGRLCFRARETKWVIREWGQSVKGEWIAFENEPWKKVGEVWGLGACLSASRLREAAEWGGRKTAEVVGIGTQERVAPVPTHPPIFGVEQKYWTNIWNCNCSAQRDLRITNPCDFPVCLAWRMEGDQVVVWVSRS